MPKEIAHIFQSGREKVQRKKERETESKLPLKIIKKRRKNSKEKKRDKGNRRERKTRP